MPDDFSLKKQNNCFSRRGFLKRIRKTVLCKLKSSPLPCMCWLKAQHLLQETAWTAFLERLGKKKEDSREGAIQAALSVQNNNDVPTSFCLCISALRGKLHSSLYFTERKSHKEIRETEPQKLWNAHRENLILNFFHASELHQKLWNVISGSTWTSPWLQNNAWIQWTRGREF